MNKKGFTLVEIIVVLVILAILSAVAVPSVLGYVKEAREVKDLNKLRESMLASQVTLVKTYASGDGFGDHTGSNNNENKKLTETQAKDLKNYLALEKDPYILMFGAADSKYVGTPDENKAFNVYCIIYQETKDSKPWFYDGKSWSHRYLWTKSNSSVSGKDPSRLMYSDNNGNYMNDIKDSDGNDLKVTLYMAYIEGVAGKDENNHYFWNNLKNASE